MKLLRSMFGSMEGFGLGSCLGLLFGFVAGAFFMWFATTGMNAQMLVVWAGLIVVALSAAAYAFASPERRARRAQAVIENEGK